MGFAQDLRVYLEGLERTVPVPSALPFRHIDVHELHRHFLGRMRELERAGNPARVKQLFEKWSKQLVRFARYLETLPKQLVSGDPAEALAFACHALDEAISGFGFGSTQTLVDRLELQRIVAAFDGSHASIEGYALENCLGRRSGPRLVVTELGRVFLRLHGKDAVRWLLTNEVVQSTGSADPWHVSRELLLQAAAPEGPTAIFYLMDLSGVQTLSRLISLGILVGFADEEPEISRPRVEAAMRDVVEAVLEPGPWHSAIRALLDDERAAVVPGTSSSAVEATVEQTKLIAHEVRNALIPVRHDIDALRSLVVEPSQLRRVDNARDGVVRVLDFVEAMVQMSELITEQPSRCDLGSVIEEALGWVDTARRVQRLLPPGELHVVAPRTRLARSISNVVGNALQATVAGQLVRVAVARAPGVVQVIVDDGGPGVPIEHRRRVFLEGVTMRKDGAGSGFGLAFAQRVVEGALHGRIWCEDSDLGGARFVIEVPEPSPE